MPRRQNWVRGGFRVQDASEKRQVSTPDNFPLQKKYVANFKNNMGILETKWKALRKPN